MLNRRSTTKSENMLPVMEIVLPQMTSNVPAFLGKLWKMVDDPDTDYLISWSDEGNSFIIHNQAEFAQALLPYYYKHSNMASFVRQLNMYGFHKVVGVDSGGLKSERQEEMEFAHPCFLRGNEQLLEQIRRKVANKQTPQTTFVPSIRQERVNEVLNEVSQLKDKQEDMDTKLDTMKKENEALWREVVALRQKHSSQQKIVNKLIQFLMSVVQPRMGNAVKRRYQPQLAIEDSAGQGGSSPAKHARKSDGSTVVGPTPDGNAAAWTLGAGPVIQDVTHDDDTDSMFLPTSDDDVTLSSQPMVETPLSPLSAAVMQAVNPLLVSPAVSIAPGTSKNHAGVHAGSANHRDQSNTPSKKPAANVSNTNNSNTTTTAATNGNNKMSLSTTMMTPTRRPLLQREISKEDFDLETTLMQKDLDNLKEMLSGQITFDTSILSNIFNPEEPLAAYFASNSNTDFMNQKLPLELEAANNSSEDVLDQPTLFELADIDEDNNFTNPDPSTGKSSEETVPELIDLDDDFSASLNTPLVHFDGVDSPLLSQIRDPGRKNYRK